MYSIEFSKVARKELADYKKSNPTAFKRIAKMLEEMNKKFKISKNEPRLPRLPITDSLKDIFI